MNVEVILATLLYLTPWHLDHDTVEERTALLRPLAQALVATTKDPEEMAALIAQPYMETKFARLVMTGHCDQMPAGIRCDGGRARGPFQVHGFCKAAWSVPDGTVESYRAGAACVRSTMRLGKMRCHTWDGAFAALQGTGNCKWDRADAYTKQQNQILTWWKTGVVWPSKKASK
jgi:hypothetical protein